MDLHAGTVQRDGLQGDAHDLLPLQLRKNSRQDPTLGPAVQPGVDGMPLAELGRQPPPLAPVLSHIQNGIEHLVIGETHVAALDRQTVGDTLVLGFGNFPLPSLSHLAPVV